MIGSGERTPVDLARGNSPFERKVANMVRKMIVLFTPKGTWELQGFRELKERVRAEVFQGVGIWARPPANSKITAVVVSVGDSDNQVVIALRDEKTRQAVAAAIADDETLLHNTRAGVHLKADGTIDVRAHGGAAVPLATLADLQALRNWVANLAVGGSGSAIIPGCPSPTGTTVLKGQ